MNVTDEPISSDLRSCHEGGCQTKEELNINSKERRILIMSKKDPRMSGGVESVVMGILSALRRTSYRVTLTFFGEAGHSNLMAVTRQYRSTGLTTIDSLIYGLFAGLEAYHEEFDVVNPHGEVGFAYGAMHRLRRRCGRFIATSHGVSWYALGSYAHLLPWPRRILMAIYRPIIALAEGMTFRSADVVIAVSKGVADEIIGLYHINPQKIRVIHNEVDTKIFHPRAREDAIRHLGLNGEKRYLLYVGRERLRKNLAMAVSTVNELERRGLSYELLAVGVEPDQLPSFARNGQVRALGKVPPEDFPYVFNVSDALIHPSLYEGHPITPLEALASGTPVVASVASKMESPTLPFIKIVEGTNSKEYADAIVELTSLNPDPWDIACFYPESGSYSYNEYVKLFDSECSIVGRPESEAGRDEKWWKSDA